MDFEQQFEGPALLAKQMELRWFHHPDAAADPSENEKSVDDAENDTEKETRNTKERCSEKLNNHKPLSNPEEKSKAPLVLIKHRMPFLRRSLSFVREASPSLKRKFKDRTTRWVAPSCSDGKMNFTVKEKIEINRKNGEINSTNKKKESSKTHVDLCTKEIELVYFTSEKMASQAAQIGSKVDSMSGNSSIVAAMMRDKKSGATTSVVYQENNHNGEDIIEAMVLDSTDASLSSDIGIDINNTNGKNAMSADFVVTAFGKALPPYDPRLHGLPKPGKTAFDLFCGKKSDLRNKVPRNGRGEKQIQRRLKSMWDKLHRNDVLFWKQEEAWDEQRYLHEKEIYKDLNESKVRTNGRKPNCTIARKENNAKRKNGASLTISSPSPKRRKRVVKDKAVSATAEKTNGNDKAATSRAKKKTPKTPKVPNLPQAFFHYLHMGKDGFPAAHVEMRQDRRCPLCSFNACSDAGLVMHCRATHSGLLFDGVRDEEGNLHVVVRSDNRSALLLSCSHERLRNFTYVRPPSSKCSSFEIPFITRPAHKAANLDQVIKKKKIRLLQENGAKEEAISPYILGNQVPIRQYYHSRTNLPMQDGDWNYDSDEDADDTWLHNMSDQLLDEFEDVSDKEKMFMKLWNKFIKSYTTVSDRDLLAQCISFIQIHSQELKKLNLRQNLLLHLFNLWDSSLLSSAHISLMMSEYDGVGCKSNPNEGNGENKFLNASKAKEMKASHKTPIFENSLDSAPNGKAKPFFHDAIVNLKNNAPSTLEDEIVAKSSKYSNNNEDRSKSNAWQALHS